MPTPLTVERFEQFVELFTEKHGETVARLDKIDERLDRIEQLLWHGQRVDELERRLRAVAEEIGRPDLATPLVRPFADNHP